MDFRFFRTTIVCFYSVWKAMDSTFIYKSRYGVTEGCKDEARNRMMNDPTGKAEMAPFNSTTDPSTVAHLCYF